MIEPRKTARRVALGFILGLAVLTAIGCGGNDSRSEPTPEARPSAATSSTTAREVIAALRRADLEIGTVSKITPDQLGVAPNVATSALRFLIPSLGGDNGGRAFSFESVKDLRKTKKPTTTWARNRACCSRGPTPMKTRSCSCRSTGTYQRKRPGSTDG